MEAEFGRSLLGCTAKASICHAFDFHGTVLLNPLRAVHSGSIAAGTHAHAWILQGFCTPCRNLEGTLKEAT
jgi:hypothetical protein